MKTLGIDLAAQSKATYACRIAWDADGARIEALDGELDDDALVARIEDLGVDSIGVDVPFGWPRAFRALLEGTIPESYERAGKDLRLRRTDVWCAETLRVQPLSVSSDRIAWPAMRWRIVEARLARDRSTLHEVYPAAALQRWGTQHRKYKEKGHERERAAIVEHLTRALSIELDDDQRRRLTTHADALDAFVASSVARAVALDRVHPIPDADREHAIDEGWIRIPDCDLSELLR